MENLVWMVPSFYGDLRLEALGKNKSRLLVTQATINEVMALRKLKEVAAKKGWCPETQEFVEGPPISLDAPIHKVAKVLAKVLKPGRETVSAIRIANGKIEEVTEATFETAPIPTTPVSEDKGGKIIPLPKKEEKKDEKPVKVVATTVAKPALGCPPPDFPSAELKAREVLTAFLTDEQREDFQRYNRFVTIGAVTGRRYMVTSRHALSALKIYERSLYDLDREEPICTHDHSVPAAEEMLALHLLMSLPNHERFVVEHRGMPIE